MQRVKAYLVVEMMGKPAGHLKEQLNTHVIKLGSEKGVKLVRKKYHDPKEVEDVKGIFHAFSEMEAEFDSFESFFSIIFNYMPANVEIFEPERFKMQSNELNQLSNYLLSRLHKYDALAQSLVRERQEMMDKLKQQEKKG